MEIRSNMNKDLVKNILISIIGSLLFGFALNFFIIPLNLYSGGFTGLSQLIEDIINLILVKDINIQLTGIIYFCINIPLLVFSYKMIGKKFIIKSIICIFTQSIVLTLVPIPKELLLTDPLTACIIAGIVAGIGSGLILRSGSSGGGMDIVGVYLTSKYKNLSVGKVALILNLILFTFIYFINGEVLDIVVYSIIYSSILNLVIDQVFTQNISVTATIITKHNDMDQHLIKYMQRGVTAIDAIGSYTGEHCNYLVTIISKYEMRKLKRVVSMKDTNAFVIINKNSMLMGNYEKRLQQ